MAELNNRKRKLSSENTMFQCEEDAGKKQNTKTENAFNNEMEPNSDTRHHTTEPKTDDIPLISKSSIKSFSRFLPRNVVGTIGRKTTLITRRTLRSAQRRGSLQTLNRGWDTISNFSPLENDDSGGNPKGETTQKQKQALTLKLRKLKEKFKTNPQLKKDRFRSMKTAPQDRFRKDLNQSMVENKKQAKLLEKLLEKHNKHLESL